MNALKSSALLALIALAGCAGTSADGTTTAGIDQRTSPPVAPTESGSTAATAEAPRPAMALSRSLHTSNMTEVALEPQGTAALTLDEDGGVRLWTSLMGDDVEAPLALPVRDPVWMSVARKDDSSFVAAFIDTSGGAQIGRIETTDRGAKWTPLFDHPPTRPMFELHVLDGGDRVLALSVDHQIELWSAKGKVLAEIDEPGFVPWQLRVAQQAGGDPEVLAVLGRPVRVQKVTVHDDALSIEGQPHPVAMDRGPNRNDLVMSPDGTYVTVLRRPKARGKRFEVEITDLETGDRRLVAAESDLGKRPRVHAVGDRKLLIESGSGAGFTLDLEQAVPWPPDGVDPLDASQVPSTLLTANRLSGSTEESRFHVDLAGGVRAVPSGRSLIVAPLDERPAVEHRAADFGPTALGLNDNGQRVIWGVPGELVVENLEDNELQRVATAGRPALVAFVDAGNVVSMDGKGRLALQGLDGEVIARDKLDFSWGVSAAGWRRSDDGGSIVLSSLKPGESLRIQHVSPVGFGDSTNVARAEQASWPEAGKPRKRESRVWLEELGLSWDALNLRPATVQLSEPDPTGSMIAIVQKTRDVADFVVGLDEGVGGPDEFVITMVDRESNKRLWTRLSSGIQDIAWSGDGATFGFVDADGGHLCRADNGEIKHARRDLGLVSG